MAHTESSRLATLQGCLVSNSFGDEMRRLRQITEQKVIADFLKSEFYHHEFAPYRRSFEHLVSQADVTDPGDNVVRRALLYRRRGHMWRELPASTEWWEVRLEPSDMKSIHVFPRAQWRRIANGSYLLCDVAQRIKTSRVTRSARECVKKMDAIARSLRLGADLGCVLLIGVDESSALTILDGNHRLTAALLEFGIVPQNQIRVVCGFSPRMYECCWYETNVPNLWHYAKSRIKSLFDDKEVRVMNQPRS
jgi:hypothetical protein